MRKTAFAVIAMILVLVFGTMTSYGKIDDSKAYGYTVTVYSGEQGHFSGGKTEVTINCEPGKTVVIDLDALGFKMDNDEYYPRGLRQAGHDNDEMLQSPMTLPSVDEDMSFEVAYGIKGGMVSYVVNYVEKNSGKTLRHSDTYYGMKGDKPVVSYKYIENYQPQAYKLGKTLSADESQNVFDFKYVANKNNGTDDQNNNGQNNNGNNDQNNNGQNGQNAAGQNAGANAQNAGDGQAVADADAGNDNAAVNNGPADYMDLDEGDVPLATPEDENSGIGKLPLLAGIAAGLLIVIGLIAFALRRRRAS